MYIKLIKSNKKLIKNKNKCQILIKTRYKNTAIFYKK